MSIQKRLTNIQNNITQLTKIEPQLQNAVSQKDFKAHMTLFDENYKKLKYEFDLAKSETQDLKSKSESASNIEPTERQMLDRNANLFFKTIKTKLTETQEIYNNFRKISKKLLAKQVKNIDLNNSLRESKIEDLVEEDPDLASKMLQEKMYGKTSAKMQNAAQDILEKCEGIKKLQGQVKELVEMIKGMAAIVSEQGEQIDSIGVCVLEAKDYIQNVKINLEKAKEHNESSRCVS